MPTDRHEALHLVLGFLKDNGLTEAYRTVCWEAGLDASVEELAPHVSLMRILLDWKRAFEARFQGTPRIIQPVTVKTDSVPPNHGPLQGLGQPLQQHHSQQAFQEPTPQPGPLHGSGHGLSQATFQLPPSQQLPRGAAEMNGNSSLPTISYAPGNGNQLLGSNQALFRSPAAQMVQGQGPGVVLAQAQQLGSSELNDQVINGLRAAGAAGLLQPQRAMDPASLPTGLPPRPPGVMPSHSSSLYSPHDATDQDCSTRDDAPGWQTKDDENGAHNALLNAGGWLAQPNSMANNQLLAAGRRSSGGGANLPPVTKLKGSVDTITQEQFLEVISAVGPGANAVQLFEFRRPQRGSSSSARRSAILNLDDAQHDAMYALAGCEDVNFLISNVQSDVRLAMHKVFGIDKESFTVWFKNRGRNPSKTQYAGAYSGKTGMKRARLTDIGNGFD